MEEARLMARVLLLWEPSYAKVRVVISELDRARKKMKATKKKN